MESDVLEPIGCAEGVTRPGRTHKKPKDLCESEDFGSGEGVGVYDTLMESDTVEPSGHVEGDTRPGRTRKKPKSCVFPFLILIPLGFFIPPSPNPPDMFEPILLSLSTYSGVHPRYTFRSTFPII